MNPILMFFRERRSGREPPRRWVIEVAGRKLSLDWYSAAPLADPPEFSQGSFPEIEDYRRFHEEIRTALSRGEGGLLATTRPEATGATVEVEWVHSPTAGAVELSRIPAPLAALSPEAGEGREKPLSPEGRGVGERGYPRWQETSLLKSTELSPNPGAYLPPNTAFCVDPEDGLIEYPLVEPQTELALRAGSLLILPVDAEAEARFRSFRTEYLSWFPPDFQTMMLGVLRKPSLDLLDSRVARLEEILLGIAEGQSRESRRLSTWFDRLIGQGKALNISLAAMGILAAALLGFVLGLKSNSVPPPAANRSPAEETKPETETQGENPAGEAPTRNPPDALEPGSSENPAGHPPDPAASIRDLMTLLSQKDSPKPDAALAGLWESHFRSLPGIVDGDRNALEKLYGQPDFLWGMFKLPALLAMAENPKGGPVPKAILGNPGKIPVLADEYRRLLKNPGGILTDPSIRAMLADLLCRLRAVETRADVGKAMEKQFFDPNTKNTTLFTDQPCPAAPGLFSEREAPAIRRLVEEVRKRSPEATENP